VRALRGGRRERSGSRHQVGQPGSARQRVRPASGNPPDPKAVNAQCGGDGPDIRGAVGHGTAWRRGRASVAWAVVGDQADAALSRVGSMKAVEVTRARHPVVHEHRPAVRFAGLLDTQPPAVWSRDDRLHAGTIARARSRVKRLVRLRLSPVSGAARRLVIPMLLIVFAGISACGGAQAANTPAIGDSCLVGSWTLQHEENRSGYSYAGTPVAVSGLAGAKLTVANDGSETEVFDGSQPLVGTAPDGRALSISISGSVKLHIHGDGMKYVTTGTRMQMPTVATIAGVRIADYQSYYTPGHGTYKCAGQSLAVTNGTAIQTDTWSRS
jgi:hypothetical protein